MKGNEKMTFARIQIEFDKNTWDGIASHYSDDDFYNVDEISEFENDLECIEYVMRGIKQILAIHSTWDLNMCKVVEVSYECYIRQDFSTNNYGAQSSILLWIEG